MAAISKSKLFPPPIIKFEWPKHEINIKPNKEEHIKEHKGNIIKEKPEYNSGARPGDEEGAKDGMRRQKKRMQRTAARNIRPVMGERELQGKHRFVAEGFANDSECNKLMELAQVNLSCVLLHISCDVCILYVHYQCDLKTFQVAAVQGDGYSGNRSPHTNFERFEGVSLGRAALVRIKHCMILMQDLKFSQQ
jgi:hypothetical protein